MEWKTVTSALELSLSPVSSSLEADLSSLAKKLDKAEQWLRTLGSARRSVKRKGSNEEAKMNGVKRAKRVVNNDNSATIVAEEKNSSKSSKLRQSRSVQLLNLGRKKFVNTAVVGDENKVDEKQQECSSNNALLNQIENDASALVNDVLAAPEETTLTLQLVVKRLMILQLKALSSASVSDLQLVSLARCCVNALMKLVEKEEDSSVEQIMMNSFMVKVEMVDKRLTSRQSQRAKVIDYKLQVLFRVETYWLLSDPQCQSLFESSIVEYLRQMMIVESTSAMTAFLQDTLLLICIDRQPGLVAFLYDELHVARPKALTNIFSPFKTWKKMTSPKSSLASDRSALEQSADNVGQLILLSAKKEPKGKIEKLMKRMQGFDNASRREINLGNAGGKQKGKRKNKQENEKTEPMRLRSASKSNVQRTRRNSSKGASRAKRNLTFDADFETETNLKKQNKEQETPVTPAKSPRRVMLQSCPLDDGTSTTNVFVPETPASKRRGVSDDSEAFRSIQETPDIDAMKKGSASNTLISPLSATMAARTAFYSSSSGVRNVDVFGGFVDSQLPGVSRVTEQIKEIDPERILFPHLFEDAEDSESNSTKGATIVSPRRSHTCQTPKKSTTSSTRQTPKKSTTSSAEDEAASTFLSPSRRVTFDLNPRPRSRGSQSSASKSILKTPGKEEDNVIKKTRLSGVKKSISFDDDHEKEGVASPFFDEPIVFQKTLRYDNHEKEESNRDIVSPSDPQLLPEETHQAVESPDKPSDPLQKVLEEKATDGNRTKRDEVICINTLTPRRTKRLNKSHSGECTSEASPRKDSSTLKPSSEDSASEDETRSVSKPKDGDASDSSVESQEMKSMELDQEQSADRSPANSKKTGRSKNVSSISQNCGSVQLIAILPKKTGSEENNKKKKPLRSRLFEETSSSGVETESEVLLTSERTQDEPLSEQSGAEEPVATLMPRRSRRLSGNTKGSVSKQSFEDGIIDKESLPEDSPLITLKSRKSRKLSGSVNDKDSRQSFGEGLYDKECKAEDSPLVAYKLRRSRRLSGSVKDNESRQSFEDGLNEKVSSVEDSPLTALKPRMSRKLSDSVKDNDSRQSWASEGQCPESTSKAGDITDENEAGVDNPDADNGSEKSKDDANESNDQTSESENQLRLSLTSSQNSTETKRRRKPGSRKLQVNNDEDTVIQSASSTESVRKLSSNGLKKGTPIVPLMDIRSVMTSSNGKKGTLPSDKSDDSSDERKTSRKKKSESSSGNKGEVESLLKVKETASPSKSPKKENIESRTSPKNLPKEESNEKSSKEIRKRGASKPSSANPSEEDSQTVRARPQRTKSVVNRFGIDTLTLEEAFISPRNTKKTRTNTTPSRSKSRNVDQDPIDKDRCQRRSDEETTDVLNNEDDKKNLDSEDKAKKDNQDDTSQDDGNVKSEDDDDNGESEDNCDSKSEDDDNKREDDDDKNVENDENRKGEKDNNDSDESKEEKEDTEDEDNSKDDEERNESNSKCPVNTPLSSPPTSPTWEVSGLTSSPGEGVILKLNRQSSKKKSSTPSCVPPSSAHSTSSKAKRQAFNQGDCLSQRVLRRTTNEIGISPNRLQNLMAIAQSPTTKKIDSTTRQSCNGKGGKAKYNTTLSSKSLYNLTKSPLLNNLSSSQPKAKGGKRVNKKLTYQQ